MRIQNLPDIRRGAGGRWLALALLALYMLSTGGDLFISDGEVILKTTAELAFARSIALQPDPGLPQIVPGRDGRFFSKYGLGQPLAALPFFRAGLLLARLGTTPAAADRLLRLTVISFNAVVSAGAALLLYLSARRLANARVGLLLAALYGLATPAWPYSKIYFSEPLLTFCLLLACYALLVSRAARRDSLVPGPIGWALLAGVAAGYAMLTKPLAGVALPVCAAYLALTASAAHHRGTQARRLRAAGIGQAMQASDGRRALLSLLAFGLGALPFVALTLFHNYYRFGSLFDNGYGAERFSTPFYIGLYGLLFSSGRGLFWYAPPVVLGLLALRVAWQHERALTLLCAGLILPPLLITARWWAWHGGWGWGPRLVMPYLPFLLLLAAPLLRTGHGWRLAWMLLVAGTLIQLPGVVVNFNQYMGGVVLPSPVGRQLAAPAEPQAAGTLQETLPYLLPDDLAYYVPEYSPILGQTHMLVRGEGLFVNSFSLAASGIPFLLAVMFPAAWLAALALALVMLARQIQNDVHQPKSTADSTI